MDEQQYGRLQTRALTLLSEREKTVDLTVVHVATDLVPSTKARIFKFFAAKKETPNDPRYEIVLDEHGEPADLESFRKGEGVELFVRRDLVVDRAQLPQLGMAEAPITIKPVENNLTLNSGDSLEELITVTIPKSSAAQKVDVYLLADTTGSMGPVLANVQMSVDAILTGLTGVLGLDLAFGVGNYKDFPSPGASPFQHQVSVTTDLAVVRGAINAWVASGGGDIPEGQLFALEQLAEDRDGVIGWRFDAKPIIVWFGDAPGHDKVCRALTGLDQDISEGRVSGALSRRNITLIAISTSTGPGLNADPTAGAVDYVATCGNPAGSSDQATRLTDATLGTLLTDVEPTAIVTAILDTLADAVSTINDVHLDPVGAAGAFVDAINPRRVGPLDATVDQAVQFHVRFKGVQPCADAAQEFEGSIAVVVDGDVKATKTLRVTVPRCPRITEIEGDPSAAVARINFVNDTGQISVFTRGGNAQLLRCFNNGDPEIVANWPWEDWGRPGGPGGTRVSDAPFGIASFQESVNQHNDFIHAFVKGGDGHLYEIFWDGTQRSNWIDHNQPYWQASLAASPTVVTFRRTYYLPQDDTYEWDSVDQLGAFVWGSDSLLYQHHENWHGHGRPPGGADVGSVPGVCHRPFFFIYAFFVGNDRHLYARHTTNVEKTSWGWVDLGQPNENTGTGVLWFWRPGVVSFFHDQQNRLYTFVTGTDNHLWVHVWRGREPRLPNPDSGQWFDRGTPNNVSIASAASVVTCPHNGNDQIYAYVRGSDRHLYVQFWDAMNSVWVWRDLEQPASATVRSEPSAVVCRYPNSDPLYVFIRGSDDHLYMCHMDSGINNWQWKDLSVQP
jgi:hypothetical protein